LKPATSGTCAAPDGSDTSTSWMIVVDTSAWIEFLRATGSRVDRTLARHVADGADLAVTEMVVAEVLCGARDTAHRAALRARLLALEMLPLGGLADFEAAADLFVRCRQQGATVRRLADCLIAVPALRAGAEILHADADFDLIARCAPLRIAPLDA
jgi:predicted nucleic acid-binding protein